MPTPRREPIHEAPSAGSPGLSTARAVLQVQALLARHPEGVRADRVAVAVGKSVSTAYNLLASLSQEGVAVHAAGVYRLAREFRELVAAGADEHPPVATEFGEALEELFLRTHRRAYLALVQDGHLRVVLTRGLQGMPKLKGLDEALRDDALAHAHALGKVALAFGPAGRLQRHLADELRAVTPHTVTRPDTLLVQLAAIRSGAVAVDRGELDERLWGLAAPLLDGSGRLLGALAVSVSARTAPAEHERLAALLSEVAEASSAPSDRPFQACGDGNELLGAEGAAPVASRALKSVPAPIRRGAPTAAAPQNRRHGQ